MANMEVKHSGSWRTLTSVEVKHSGAWRSVKKVYAKHAGAWREVFSALTALFNTNGDGNIILGSGTCYAGLQINSNGSEYEYNNAGTAVSIGTWLVNGTNSEVWVECVLGTGSWNSINAGTGTRLQCNTTRSWRVSTTGAATTVSCNFKFWDAASGGNLLDETGTILFTAEVETI